MNEAITSVFLEAIGTTYKKHLENNIVGRVTSNFWQIFNTFLTKIGKIKPMDLENNSIRMEKDWDPSSPIEDLFAQINNANEYSIFIQHPYGDRDLVQTGEVVLHHTNMFAAEYKDWRLHDATDRDGSNFQEWSQEAYDLKEEVETTAASIGYGDNAQQSDRTNTQAPDDSAYEESVRYFGTAFAANSETFATLSEANQQMGKKVAANVQSIQTRINEITNILHNMNAARPPRQNAPTQPEFPDTPQQEFTLTQTPQYLPP